MAWMYANLRIYSVISSIYRRFTEMYYCPTLSYRTTLVQFDDIDNADMYGFIIT